MHKVANKTERVERNTAEPTIDSAIVSHKSKKTEDEAAKSEQAANAIENEGMWSLRVRL